jgi:amphi-Trp domain-containing protein
MDADTQNVGTRGTEPLMSDVEIKRTESLSREEAAERLSALAAALSEGGHVEVRLGASTVKLHVPDHVQCEVEVEVDGDDVELEVELTWSTAPVAQPASVPPPQSAPRQAGRTRSAKRAAGN